jgi:hypothetical protein
LIFVYLLMSIIVTAVNELVASALNLRGKDLRAGLFSLVQNPSVAARLLDHPLVRSLRKGNRLPSYIPPGMLSLALLDTVTSGQAGGDLVARLKASVQGNTPLERVLRLILEDARDDIEKVKQAVAAWFDDAMDRVSGWYRRRMQWMSLGLALIATVALNVDSLALASQLWREPALRSAVTAQAAAYVQQVESEAARQRAEEEKAGPKGGPPAPPPLLPYDVTGETSQERLEDTIAELKATGLAIGWANETGGWAAAVRSHWLGWLFTAWAPSLGAPFWFDLLKRIMSIRSAGRSPQEKPGHERGGQG